MISVAEALARVLAGLAPVSTEIIPVGQGFGRVLAEDLVARRTQPPFAVSAMDGYAARSADLTALPARLRVVGYIQAGGRHDGSIGPGEAARIFTGAPVPDGADCIVIQEDTEAIDGPPREVLVTEAAGPGRYIRPAGLDFREGEVGLRAGRVLSARDIGLAAAMNRPWLTVRRKPRIAILPTGDEVVLPGEPVGPNQIVSSNGFALAALIEACGGIPIQLGIAPDEPGALRDRAAGAAGADLLVTTGGASVGEHDLIRSALGEAGLTLDFWNIAMRPGKPLMFGSLAGTPLLGLPGNPVSTVVCGLLFLKPAIDHLLGIPATDRPAERARLGADLPANDRRQDYLRATKTLDTDGATIATAFERQDSSMLSRLADADCLIIRPPHAAPAMAGEMVEILRFDSGGPRI
ncbi:MAG TPA: gephyrin-like molybdotransferase Glp [Stellaceae bacterium]|nr:gephyrin-like molybdotransferase Glp [Stellaceae bacterium]